MLFGKQWLIELEMVLETAGIEAGLWAIGTPEGVVPGLVPGLVVLDPQV